MLACCRNIVKHLYFDSKCSLGKMTSGGFNSTVTFKRASKKGSMGKSWSLEDLFREVPLKWGPWHSKALLLMPFCGGNSEIPVFLGRFGKFTSVQRPPGLDAAAHVEKTRLGPAGVMRALGKHFKMPRLAMIPNRQNLFCSSFWCFCQFASSYFWFELNDPSEHSWEAYPNNSRTSPVLSIEDIASASLRWSSCDCSSETKWL